MVLKANSKAGTRKLTAIRLQLAGQGVLVLLYMIGQAVSGNMDAGFFVVVSGALGAGHATFNYANSKEYEKSE